VLALDGELVLRSYGTVGDGGDTVLGVRLARLSRLDWRLGPQPVLPDEGRSLVGPELTLVAAPDGTFYPKRMEGPYNNFPDEDPGDDDTLPVDERDSYSTELVGYFYPPGREESNSGSHR
jgi:hypothetical protein